MAATRSVLAAWLGSAAVPANDPPNMTSERSDTQETVCRPRSCITPLLAERFCFEHRIRFGVPASAVTMQSERGLQPASASSERGSSQNLSELLPFSTSKRAEARAPRTPNGRLRRSSLVLLKIKARSIKIFFQRLLHSQMAHPGCNCLAAGKEVGGIKVSGARINSSMDRQQCIQCCLDERSSGKDIHVHFAEFRDLFG